MRSIIIPIVCGVSLIGSACATKRETGAVAGAVGGAAVGGIVGGRTGALVGGALGGIAGYAVGRDMEEQDRRQMAYALEANRPVRWENPQTGHAYRVEPRETYYVEPDRPCREFRMFADVEGEGPQEVYGTACRQPDGSWEVVDTYGA